MLSTEEIEEVLSRNDESSRFTTEDEKLKSAAEHVSDESDNDIVEGWEVPFRGCMRSAGIGGSGGGVSGSEGNMAGARGGIFILNVGAART